VKAQYLEEIMKKVLTQWSYSKSHEDFFEWQEDSQSVG